MLGKLSAKIAAHLCETATIAKEDEELYAYGFFIILSRLLFLFISAICGLILHVAIESIVFFVFFCLIRSYAGGIHASSEFKCTFYTTGALIICIFNIKCFIWYNLDYILTGILVLASTCVLAFAPLDSLEKPLSKRDKKYYKKVTWIITASVVALIIIFYFLKLKNLSISCIVSLALESILLIAGKIKEHVTDSIFKT